MFMSRLTATSMHPHKTKQHNRQIIRVIPALLKSWTTASSTLNEEYTHVGPHGHDKLVELLA